MDPKHKKPPVRKSLYAKQAEKRSSQHASSSNHSDQALPSKQLFSVDDSSDMDTDGPPTDDQVDVLDMFAKLNLSLDSESDDFLEAACMGLQQPEFPVPTVIQISFSAQTQKLVQKKKMYNCCSQVKLHTM
jgi:hypothetical protein